MTAPSDKELRRLLRDLDAEFPSQRWDARADLERWAESMARELLAARKVVRAAKRWVAAKTDAPEDYDALTDSLDAYDKARKG